MSESSYLQKRYAPGNRCFGCGPSNADGLQIHSIPTGDSADCDVVLDWTPLPHHLAFEGMLNGGIIGTLMDCHSNWTGAWHFMRRDGLETPPCTVTAEFHVKLKRPTPVDRPLHIVARAVSSEGNWVTVEATLTSGDKVTATCTGRFVAVEPGHPAYHRW
jgi:acyl-coenzyme A thioesterase PaaI-like protein